MTGHKLKLKPVENILALRLCMLDKHCFLENNNWIFSTSGKYFNPSKMIIDTILSGHEYIIVQKLLAHTLKIPQPIIGARHSNYGISLFLSEGIYQIFENITWQERIQKQIMHLPNDVSADIHRSITLKSTEMYSRKDYFPIYNLPKDACFVIRRDELDKLIDISIKKPQPLSSTRISTPLSRMFWLACKYNEAISPLIKQPYKLVSIFEQWASAEGLPDHLSGDTLKTALERGSPSPLSTSK